MSKLSATLPGRRLERKEVCLPQVRNENWMVWKHEEWVLLEKDAGGWCRAVSTFEITRVVCWVAVDAGMPLGTSSLRDKSPQP